ncbi:hypothetical protein AVEN_88709-1, partial [Araneus ventricosus]
CYSKFNTESSIQKRNKRNLTDSIDEGNLGWVSGFSGAHKSWKARRVSFTNFRAFSWDLVRENVLPIQPKITPRIFGTLELVADKSKTPFGRRINWVCPVTSSGSSVARLQANHTATIASGTDG